MIGSPSTTDPSSQHSRDLDRLNAVVLSDIKCVGSWGKHARGYDLEVAVGVHDCGPNRCCAAVHKELNSCAGLALSYDESLVVRLETAVGDRGRDVDRSSGNDRGDFPVERLLNAQRVL